MLDYKLRKGSSSILVILLVVTMLVFGVFSMMTAYAGLKMANKNADWTNDYYELEAKAEIMLYDIKNILSQDLITQNNNNEQTIFNKLQKIKNEEINIELDGSDILVSGSFKNDTGDIFVSEVLVKIDFVNFDYTEQNTQINSILDIKTWKLIPRDVTYKDTIEFKDLEVDLQND